VALVPEFFPDVEGFQSLLKVFLAERIARESSAVGAPPAKGARESAAPARSRRARARARAGR